MDHLRSLIETLKTSTYELLAVLLPGALVLFMVQTALLHDTSAAPALIVGGYAVGLAVQGGADFLLSRKRVRNWLGIELAPATEAARLVAKLITDSTKVVVPQDALLDVCLSRLENRRQVYDKFVALRDAARGMALATILIAAAAGWHWHATLSDGAVPYKILKWFALGGQPPLQRWASCNASSGSPRYRRRLCMGNIWRFSSRIKEPQSKRRRAQQVEDHRSSCLFLPRLWSAESLCALARSTVLGSATNTAP